MIKILAAVVSSLMMMSSSYAIANITDVCQPFLTAYNSALSDLDRTCLDLGRCQEYRTACPQQINEYASCNVLNDCMAEQFPDNSTPMSKCIYEWNSKPDEPGLCENKNRSVHAVAKRCPGYSNFLDRYKDQSFNCDGHKGRYWGQHSEYFRARQEYEDAMKNGTCPRINLPHPESCSAAFKSVSEVDNSHGDSLEVVSGSRDTKTVIEFFHQAYDDYRLPAGDSSTHGAGVR